MAIYDRWGTGLKILNVATADDVERLEKRKLDAYDRTALRERTYVVARDENALGSHTDRIFHLMYLRADGGLAEIQDEIARLHAPAGTSK